MSHPDRPATLGQLRDTGYTTRTVKQEIRANLLDRIAEAEREGWLGEVEGLQVSLAGADDKLTQITASLRRTADAVQLGMPAFPGIAGRSSSDRPVVKDAL